MGVLLQLRNQWNGGLLFFFQANDGRIQINEVELNVWTLLQGVQALLCPFVPLLLAGARLGQVVQARRRKTNTSPNNLTSVILIIFSLLFFKYESVR
ncbi:hypothetical protein ACIOWE_03630 [Pseudomonas sp. NPDC087598]|uniref:hypothetical protein n=1 Tax=Pseudomonas sp. NPDC087598 TaxID=3364440 RepID=UPI0037FA4596